MSGCEIFTVKELMGHKDIKMTMRYSNLAPSHKTKAVDVLDKALSDSSTSQLLHKIDGGRK